MKTIAVIEGDDAAPEAVRPVVALLDAMNIGLNWVYPVVGEAAEAETGSIFPAAAQAMIDRADTTLFGSTSGKSGAALHYLRWGKETYANVRPCRHLPGCASPLLRPEGMDFVIVRENLEDLYVGVEGDLHELAPLALTGRTTRRPVHELGHGSYAVKAITREGTERVVRFAFELAKKRDGKRIVTCATKHNMLRVTDGLFLEVAREVAADYDDVAFESFIVDDFACRMIREPHRFDVVVMPNQYGDILSDAAGGLVGSLGLAASGCFGDDYAYFEPAHGTAPDIAGRNIINPTATILSTTMMLDYLGLGAQARRIEDAVARVYAEGGVLTPDQGGTASTTDFCTAVRHAL
jgi:isocitrate/isopropylmalate dehydrogenase